MNRFGIAALVAAIALVVLAVGASFGAFSASTSTPVSTFTSAADFSAGTLRAATGTYTGNGAANRPVAIGFQPDVVIVKAATNRVGVLRTSSMTGDATKPLSGATALTAGQITSLTATGFTVSANNSSNATGTTYTWTALRAAAGVLKVGTYTGDGTAGKAVSGLGFSPEYVAVASAGTRRAIQHSAGMTSAFQFDSNAGAAGRITGLAADGFSVGNSADTNAAATTYHYVAFNEVAGAVDVGTSVGTGTSGRSVTGLGFSPLWVNLRANDTATAREAQQRSVAVTGTASQFYSATANLPAVGIRALLEDGYQLGTDASVNANGVTYHHLAVANTGGGCALPGAQTLTATADSWVEQSAPAATHGADATLKLTSRTPNANNRALFGFTLPAVPAGCTLQSANLRVYNSSPVAGRTVDAQANATAWTQAAVTWTNKPALAGTAVGAPTPPAAAYMQWDVLALTQAMLSGANNGFQLKDRAEDGPGTDQALSSLESGANRPELVLTFG